MKKVLISTLRDKNSSISQFRNAADGIGFILAWELSALLEKEKISIKTPIATTTGEKIKNNIVFIPILRSGLSILPPFIKVFPNANVGFLGMKRDEKTFIPELYYKNSRRGT